MKIIFLLLYFISFSFAGYYLYDPSCKNGSDICRIWHSSCPASTNFSTTGALSFASCNTGLSVVWVKSPNSSSYCDYRGYSENIATYECLYVPPCPIGTVGQSPNCYCPTNESISLKGSLTCYNGSTSNTVSCASGKVTVQHVNANNSSGIYIKSGGNTYYCGIDGSACPDALISGASTGFSICNSTNLPSCTYSAGDAGKEFKTKLSCVDLSSSSAGTSSASNSSASQNVTQIVNGSPNSGNVNSEDLPPDNSGKDYTGLLQAQLKELDSIKWDQRHGNNQNDEQTGVLKDIRDKEEATEEKDYFGPLGIISNFLSKIYSKLNGDLVNLDSINGNLNLEAGNIDTLESFPDDYDTSAIVDTSKYNIDTSFSNLPKFDSSGAVAMVDKMADSAESRLSRAYSKLDVLPTTTCACTDVSPSANLPILGTISFDDYLCTNKYLGLDFYGMLSAFLKILVVFICIRLALEAF